MKNIISLILICFIVLSCTVVRNADSSSKVGKHQDSIERTQWKLSDRTKGKTPTIVIENGKISGNAGCNNYFATLTMNQTNGTFEVSKIGSTRMMCNNSNEENRFLNILQTVNKYVTNGETLELYKDHLLLIRFNKVK